VDGETRDIKTIRTIKGKKMIAVARNNNTIKIFSLPGDTFYPVKK
jgi:hypothetical protein